MNPIKVCYAAQLAFFAGCRDESVCPEKNQSLENFLKMVAKHHSEPFQNMLFTDQGHIRRNIVLSVDNEQVTDSAIFHLAPTTKEVFILTPMAGG